MVAGRRLYSVLVTLVLGIAATISPAQSANDAASVIILEPPKVVERWYVALGAVNRRAFAELISDDAKIVQNSTSLDKREFINSLDEWAIRTKDASIVYRFDAIEDGSAAVLVCYRSKTSEELLLERFTFAGGQITGSVQQALAPDCGRMQE